MFYGENSVIKNLRYKNNLSFVQPSTSFVRPKPIHCVDKLGIALVADVTDTISNYNGLHKNMSHYLHQ